MNTSIRCSLCYEFTILGRSFKALQFSVAKNRLTASMSLLLLKMIKCAFQYGKVDA
jgi:hypothetical protein